MENDSNNVLVYASILTVTSVLWVGRRVGSGRFPCGSVSKVGERWIKSSMGMARYAGGNVLHFYSFE